SSFRAKADGTFSIAQNYPDSHSIQVTVTDLNDSVYVKSIRYNSREVTGPLAVSEDGNLEIILSTKPGTIAGILRDNSGAPLGGVTVSVWSKTSFKSASTDQNGHFQIGGLAPGDYSVAGWESEPLNSGVLQIAGLQSRFASDAVSIQL